MKAPDLIGARFGRLTVIRRAPNNSRSYAQWDCLCKCGKTCIRPARQLRHFQKQGRRQSCGCWKNEISVANGLANRTHGVSVDTPKLYDVWRQMLRRCEDPACKDYPAYGGRGIEVCDAWHDPLKFVAWCVRSGYEEGLTIERKNVNRGYTPGNCTWVPNKLQAQNTRKVRVFTWQRRTLNLSEWSRFLGIYYRTLVGRANRGETPPRLFRLPK